jgi:hypothetical protein
LDFIAKVFDSTRQALRGSLPVDAREIGRSGIAIRYLVAKQINTVRIDAATAMMADYEGWIGVSVPLLLRPRLLSFINLLLMSASMELSTMLSFSWR